MKSAKTVDSPSNPMASTAERVMGGGALVPLDLHGAQWIGRGWKRDCYLHPHDPGLCIKVASEAAAGARKLRERRVSWFRAARAGGHCTTLCRGDEELFCPWPISRLEEELDAARFLRTHRSYIVNLDFVRGFERRKDQGVCLFEVGAALREVPVSRTNLAQTRALLGL